MNFSNPADDSDFQYDTESQADAGYARAIGSENTHKEWILSDRDVWYRNPYYTGLPMPHPEEEIPEGMEWDEFVELYRRGLERTNEVVVAPVRESSPDDCPF